MRERFERLDAGKTDIFFELKILLKSETEIRDNSVGVRRSSLAEYKSPEANFTKLFFACVLLGVT
jgi:hypothetical protein